MNLISLVMHGVSAMSVFAEVISVRLIMLALIGGGLVGSAGSVMIWRWGTR